MADQALSRKDRRAQIAVAAKAYGIKGPESLDLHEAYKALGQNDVARAVQLAHPITVSHPKSMHAWIVMGGAALAQREGKTAQAFFEQALSYGPKDSSALVGLAKAYVLQAMPEEAVRTAAQAIQAGATEKGLVVLFLELMHMMGRVQVAADVVTPMLAKLADPDLFVSFADMLADIDENTEAAAWLERAWRLSPEAEKFRIGRLRALVYLRRLEEADALADTLLAEPGLVDRDTAVIYKVLVLRTTNRPQDALAMAEAHEFKSPERYAEMQGVIANILQDLGRDDEADAAYLEGMHVTGAKLKVAKAYGAYLMRRFDFDEGPRQFADRLPEKQRSFIPYVNSDPENLRQLKQLFLVGEQGVGDQLALMSLLRVAPVDLPGDKITFVGDPRMIRGLEGNVYGLTAVDRSEFTAVPQALHPRELVYIGDLVRYVDPANRAAHQGPWLVPDAGRRQHLRETYERLAKGGPVIGVAWASKAMLGHQRSVSLLDMLEAVPEGALVVNLQYGDRRAEIAEAQKARPDVTIYDDPQVDQMTDLAGFFAQVAVMDRVLSIDNTTAHVAGAIGHPDAHVLVPTGSECMWYWGTSGTQDPWYGNLSLYRQETLGQWDKPLAMLKQTVCP